LRGERGAQVSKPHPRGFVEKRPHDDGANERTSLLVRLHTNASNLDGELDEVDDMNGAAYVHDSRVKSHHFILSTTKWFIVPLFLVFGFITIVISVFYFIHDVTKWTAFGIILGINIVGGFTGAFYTWKLGTVGDAVAQMKSENLKYDEELQRLAEAKEKVRTEANQVHSSVGELKNVSSDLKQRLIEFEGLRSELASIVSDNEDIQDKLHEITAICDDLVEAIVMNERAHLLTIYYELATKNRGEHITENEYKRLLARLGPDTRQLVKDHGGFKAMDKDGDGHVNVHEFQALVDLVLNIEENDDGHIGLTKQLTQKYISKRQLI